MPVKIKMCWSKLYFLRDTKAAKKLKYKLEQDFSEFLNKH